MSEPAERNATQRNATQRRPGPSERARHSPGLLTLAGLLVLLAAALPGRAEEPADEAPAAGLTAEVWPLAVPEGEAPKAVLERWRARRPPSEPGSLAIDGLSVPARDESSMVRVAGMLTAPVTGDYAFFIDGGERRLPESDDWTELWIQDDASGEWRLAQCTGNPNRRSGRTRLEADVPRRFELWVMGSREAAVEWEVRDWDPAAQGPVIAVERQIVPATALSPRAAAADDRHGDGLRDSWKERHGLDLDDAAGPDGPWGDPDGDGLPNWREQLADTDPTKADTEGRPGLVRWELWRDIPGRYVFDLRRAGHFPTGPRETRFLDRLEIPIGSGEEHGSRVRGTLVAPVGGEYTFKIIADNSAELWLGEDESWQSKRLIARANQPPGAAQLRWTRGGPDGEILPLRDEQIARVTLRAGQSYYLEILHKQDGGQDHCAVAWVLPGGEEPELIGGEHLVSWQPSPADAGDDGLPDEWQQSAGLLDASVDPALRHAGADPDGDGATNREEWLAGTDPLDSADFPESGGMLASEAWLDLPGTTIADLVTHPGFPAGPDVATRIDNLDFGHEAENYGVRLRGFLTAPDDGDYHFSIAGNNACILYLGESEDKFTKRVAARVEVGTNWRSFDTGGHLRSGPVPLERGERYYIEVLFKRGADDNGRADHSSVAWKRPGEDRHTVINPEFLSPYQPDPRDLDDDDLPDEWEILHGLDPADPAGGHGAWGDPDGDGLENFREFRLGLDPDTTDVHGTPGLALWEVWENVEGLIPAHRDDGGIAVGLWRDLRFPLEATRREWRVALDAPRRRGTNIGARLRAHIVAPETGDYVFSIAGRDVGELYLSPDDSKFNRRRIASFRHGTAFRSWDRRPGQMSDPVRLEAGAAYYIEALHGRGGFRYDDDFLSIGWKKPGSEGFKLIDSDHLVAFFRDPDDFDDDDLPDDWETRHGLDAADPRGDHGPDGDPDRDGLTNLEEYRLGTHPNNPDTDGDGVSDRDEIDAYGTDPLVKDAMPSERHAELPLVAPLAGGQRWFSRSGDGTIHSMDRRGETVWEFEVERPGIYQIALLGWSQAASPPNPGIPVSLAVDGTGIGRGVLEPGPEATRLTRLTPWLEAGSHEVTVTNHNVRSGVALAVSSLEILALAGEDADGNGLPDWLERAWGDRYRAEAPDGGFAASPACLEGVARFPGDVEIRAADGTEIPVREGLEGRWYADVPLDPSGPRSVEVSFEGGAIAETLELEWTATNLFDGGEFRVRRGDSLRLTSFDPAFAAGDSQFALVAGDTELHRGVSAEPFVYEFDTSGRLETTVGATSPDGRTTTAAADFLVVSADLGGEFHAATGRVREWTPPALPAAAELDTGEALGLAEISAPGELPRTFEAYFGAATGGTSGRVVARLPGGPILDAATIHGYHLSSGTLTGDHRLVETLSDGTRVVRVGHVIDGAIPPDLSIWIQIHVADAVFANGGAWLELTAADFDENGYASFDIYKAPGTGLPFVCHWIFPDGDGPDETATPDGE